MGKATGLMKVARIENPFRDVKGRLRDFGDLHAQLYDNRMLPAEGTERTLSCQLMLIAAAFVDCESETADQFNISLNRRGVPDIPASTHCISPGLFTAGDMRTGQSLVVHAIADGRAAAEEINQYLMG